MEEVWLEVVRVILPNYLHDDRYRADHGRRVRLQSRQRRLARDRPRHVILALLGIWRWIRHQPTCGSLWAEVRDDVAHELSDDVRLHQFPREAVRRRPGV